MTIFFLIKIIFFYNVYLWILTGLLLLLLFYYDVFSSLRMLKVLKKNITLYENISEMNLIKKKEQEVDNQIR